MRAPLLGSAAQLDALARVLLSQRSTVEAVRLAVQDPAVRPATIAAQLSAALDQLDAAFVIVGALKAVAEMSDAGETVETPAEQDGGLKKPPTFGAKRREAAAATAAQSFTISSEGNHGGQEQAGCAADADAGTAPSVGATDR